MLDFPFGVCYNGKMRKHTITISETERQMIMVALTSGEIVDMMKTEGFDSKAFMKLITRIGLLGQK